MKTKEEILKPIADHYYFSQRQKERIYDVMDEFAKELAIDFARYLEAKGINFERWSFLPEMFDEYLKSKSNEQQH
jgi:hypothetical protein